MPTNGNTTEVGRRIKAAMVLAGIRSFGELAERIGQNGYGERTLRAIADDDSDRAVQRRDLMVIADATGAPYWFFERGLEPGAATPEPGVRDVLDETRRQVDDLRRWTEAQLTEIRAVVVGSMEGRRPTSKPEAPRSTRRRERPS